MNGIFTLDYGSIGKALVSAIVFAVLAALVAIVTTNGFSVWMTDWVAVGMHMVDIGFIAGVVTLGNDLLSTNNGSLLGMTPDTTPSR